MIKEGGEGGVKVERQKWLYRQHRPPNVFGVNAAPGGPLQHVLRPQLTSPHALCTATLNTGLGVCNTCCCRPLSPLHSPCTSGGRGLEEEEGHTNTRTFPAHERPRARTRLSLSTNSTPGYMAYNSSPPVQPSRGLYGIYTRAGACTRLSPSRRSRTTRPHAPTTRSSRPLPTHC